MKSNMCVLYLLPLPPLSPPSTSLSPSPSPSLLPRHYLVILAVADNQDKLSKWSGLVESKIRILIGQLESSEGIELAHIYPRSYPPPSEEFGKGKQVLMWFIGLAIKKNDGDKTVNVTITPEIQTFTNAGMCWYRGSQLA